MIKHNAIDDLLKLLKRNGLANVDSLPSVVRTKQRSGMNYVYFGLMASLKKNFNKYPQETKDKTGRMEISMNIDGLPLFRSSNTCLWRSNTCLWPILCAIIIQPIQPVAMTCGTFKPNHLEFLLETIQDLGDILQHGFQYDDHSGDSELYCLQCTSSGYGDGYEALFRILCQ